MEHEPSSDAGKDNQARGLHETTTRTDGRMWLEVFDTTQAMRAHNREAYNKNPEFFANLEEAERSVISILQGAISPFKDFIEMCIAQDARDNAELEAQRRLNPEAETQGRLFEVAFYGAGNMVEAVIMASMSPNIRVTAIDISEEMLLEGLARLKYQNLIELSNIIVENNFVTNSWVEQLIPLINRVKRRINKVAADYNVTASLDELRSHIQVYQADMTDLSTAVHLKISKRRKSVTKQKVDLHHKAFDAVIANASVPDQPKTALLPLIHDTLRRLLPGDSFFFNTKLDLHPDHELGWVSADNALNGYWRYFTTFTLPEMISYLAQLQDPSLPVTLPPPPALQEELHYNSRTQSHDRQLLFTQPWSVTLTTIQGMQILVEFTAITAHWDAKKPPFLGVKITRLTD